DAAAAAFTALEEFVDALTDDEARARGIPGEWTIHEIVDHLVETHRPSVEELRDLLQDKRPTGGPGPASLQSADPMSRRYRELVSELKALHGAVLALLISAPDRLTGARAPLVMVINADDNDGRKTPLHWIE